MNKYVKEFMEQVSVRNAHEPEFLQAVEEVAVSVIPYIRENEIYRGKHILARMVEPERLISFRVCWVDDKGKVQINRGYRVQMNSAIGPYKGGLRFHPTVNQSIMKFLAFEQVFKNALTTLPMGGGKGGSDFDPKGKSDDEVMRFCHAYMTELYRHIGQYTDVPAGDIGVGAREVGYLFGMYKKLRNEFTGVLTGKGLSWGGSQIRPEATGYGVVYFVEDMLAERKESIQNKTIAVSGSGNVAQYAVEKAIHLGAKVITMSDSGGFIFDKDGISQEKLEAIKHLKNVKKGRISEYCAIYTSATYFPNQKPWILPCDIALPCATQNEIDEELAEVLIKNGCICVAEGANMPSVNSAIKKFIKAKIMYAPGKASNAGGVATSGLEMTQNAMRYKWTRTEVDAKLREIMKEIHDNCKQYGIEADGYINYAKGANIAGFVKVADAMLAQGVV